MSAKSLRPLEKAQGQARLILCRLRAGQTLCQASAGLPAIEMPRALQKNWALALRQIESGQGQALGALESFQRLIELELRLRRQIQNRTLLPRLQAFVLAGLSVLVGVAAWWWFPPSLQPSMAELAIALSLLAASFLTMRWMLKRFEKIYGSPNGRFTLSSCTSSSRSA